MEYLNSDGNRVRAPHTPASIEFCPGWLATIPNLKLNGVLPCSLLNTGRRLLVTDRDAEAQAEHSDFVERDGFSLGYFFTATGEVGRHLYFTPVSYFYVPSSGSRKMMSRKEFGIEKWELRQIQFSWAIEMCSTHVASGEENTAFGTTLT